MSDNEQDTPVTPPDSDTDDEITAEQVAAAEADDDDTAPQNAPDGDGADAQAAFDSKEAEKGRKRIDRAVTSMVKTLQEVLANELEYLEPCPRCATDFPGMVWKPSVKGVLPETRAAVMISMGEDPDPVLNQDPAANRCDRCDGWGKVSTGSRVHRAEKLVCEECDGRGWVGPRAAREASRPATPAYVPAESNGHADPVEQPQTDPWGRVKGEALYGVMPGYES